MEAEFSAAYDGPEENPVDIARAPLDGVAAGAVEVLADDGTRFIKASLDKDPTSRYRALELDIV